MNRNWIRSLVTVAAAALLVACSGASNNLSDPPEDSTSTTKCGDDLDCVTGRFEPGQVVGLNYVCGSIRAVTTSTGDFTCPIGSTVTFSIRHEESAFEVTLGSTTVKDALKDDRLLPTGLDGQPLRRIYITPLDLAGAGVVNADSPTAAGARSIVRLLHALNSSTPGALPIGDDPSRDIILLAADKKEFLDKLEASFNVFSVDDEGFDEKVETQLGTMTQPRAMMSVEDAVRTLEKGSFSTLAGVYQDNGFIVSTTTGELVTGYGFVISLFYGYNSVDELFGEALVGIDRKGRFFGAGSASIGNRSATATIVPYSPLRFQPVGGKVGLKGSLTDLDFRLENNDIFGMSSGVIDRNYVAISEDSYERAYGEALPSGESNRLGRISSPDVGSPYTTSGVNLVRPTNLVTTLNPVVWSQLNFPLHVKATLMTEINSVETEVGVINFSVLADGNIVTDRDADCSAVDLMSLSDGDVSEFPMGVVARVFPISSRLYIEPLLVTPNTAAFGSAVSNAFVGGLGNPVRMRVDDAAGADRFKSFRNLSGVTTDDDIALWVNKFQFFKNIHDGKEGAELADGVEGEFITEPTPCPVP